MDVHQVTHHIVEHKETSSLLDRPQSTRADKIKDRCQDLVHTLDILDFRIESSKDEEDTCHVIIVVSSFLFFVCEKLELLVAANELIFLSSGGSVKRNGKFDCRS